MQFAFLCVCHQIIIWAKELHFHYTIIPIKWLSISLSKELVFREKADWLFPLKMNDTRKGKLHARHAKGQIGCF